MTRDEFQAIYDSGPDACFALVQQMQATIQALAARVEELTAQVAQLQERLNKDSHNSHKPPSSDAFARKPKSLRPKSNKPSGGQPGHPGTTLCLSDQPHQIVEHSPAVCSGCGGSLAEVTAEGCERRQVHDLPPLALEVTEHRTLCKRCPICRTATAAAFPAGVSQPVQYGPGVRTLCVYLQYHHLLPYERTQQLLWDLFGAAPCEGSLAHFGTLCHERLSEAEAAIQEAILAAPVVHFDETGVRIAKKLHWLHVAGTEQFTFYAPHAQRGKPAFEAIGVLPGFRGTAVHDAWASYWGYPCAHALCNAHLLRELTGLQEQKHQPWAAQAIALLGEIKQTVEAAKAAGASALTPVQCRFFEARYEYVLHWGRVANPAPPVAASPKRGRPKQSAAQNLLERMARHRVSVLAFLYDFSVPFDNNLAERDLRMIKVHQKVSGCFRSFSGAAQFCRIRGYLSTLRKQGVDVLAALRRVFAGDPFIPVVQT